MTTAPLSRVKNRAELVALQRAFFDIITRPLSAGDKMSRDTRTSQMIESNSTLTSHERLQLYAQQYWWRVLDSLRDDFPGVREVVGEKRFEQLLVRYLTRHKSQSFTLRNLGRHMEGYIRRDRKLPASQRALAADVAALEWAQMEVFEAAELPPLAPSELMDPAFGTFHLVAQPHLRLLALKNPADDWVTQGRDDFLRDAASNVRLSKRSARSVTKRKTKHAGPTYLAVYRLNGAVRYRRLTPTMHRFMTEFQRGGTLERVLARVVRACPDLPQEEIAPAFREFSSLGWISRQI